VLDSTAQNAPGRGDSTPAIQAFVLGVVRVLIRGQALGDEAWHRKKARQLFKLMLTHPNRRTGKEEVIELLWPESDPETGSTNLRFAIHAMRRAFDTVEAQAGAAAVFVDRDSVWLRPDADLWVDADEFELTLAQVQRAADPMPLLQRADALYAGDYLPEDMYENWAQERREDLKRSWISLQFRLAQEWETGGDTDAAARSLQRLLQADPCNERAARELMRLLTRHGRGSDAVRVYQRLVRALHDDLDVEPPEITTVLFETARPQAQRMASIAAGSRPPINDAPDSDYGTRTSRTGAPSSTHRLHNLPAQPGLLVGRGQEIAAAKVRILTAGVRLLTFVGPGGCGKTRLALQVAGELLPHFDAGVWLVDLSVVRDPERILASWTSVSTRRTGRVLGGNVAGWCFRGDGQPEIDYLVARSFGGAPSS
jgi:DNA-binding SARP family transcriptional activator